MLMEKIIKLTESDLHNIVKETVNKVLKEDTYSDNAEVDEIFKPFQIRLTQFIKEHQIDSVADRKIGRLVHALMCLVKDSMGGKSNTEAWGINTLGI